METFLISITHYFAAVGEQEDYQSIGLGIARMCFSPGICRQGRGNCRAFKQHHSVQISENYIRSVAGIQEVIRT